MRGKYKEFSYRLIKAMQERGYQTTRSPSGVCMRTLSEIVGASEQICRRYVRGDALPEYDKVIRIALNLQVSPGWLLFGEENNIVVRQEMLIDDDLLYYILTKSHEIYQSGQYSVKDYADFVMRLIKEVREIRTSKENLEKIINLALGSIFSQQVTDTCAIG